MSVITNEPAQMSGRARLYLLVTFLTHTILSFICVWRPETFQSVSYTWIRAILPLEVWGYGFALAGLVCLIAATWKSEKFAYFGLIWSCFITAGWAGGFLAGIALGEFAGLTGPVVWISLALKDLIQVSYPLRTPFEPVTRRVLQEEDFTPEEH